MELMEKFIRLITNRKKTPNTYLIVLKPFSCAKGKCTIVDHRTNMLLICVKNVENEPYTMRFIPMILFMIKVNRRPQTVAPQLRLIVTATHEIPETIVPANCTYKLLSYA